MYYKRSSASRGIEYLDVNFASIGPNLDTLWTPEYFNAFVAAGTYS